MEKIAAELDEKKRKEEEKETARRQVSDFLVVMIHGNNRVTTTTIVDKLTGSPSKGQGVNCPRASRPKSPHSTHCFKVWGPHKVNQ